MPANSFSYKSKEQLNIFYAFAAILILFCIIAFYQEMFFLAAMPVAILGLVAVIYDYRVLYYSLWVTLPFSIEFYFGSIGMDLPTEPIMLGLTGLGLVLFVSKLDKISFKSVYHPIGAILVLHLFWILFTSIFSQSPVVSYKFFAAKIWYVVPFFFLSFHMIKDDKDIDRIMRILAIFLSIAIAFVVTRHALEGFTFKASHKVVRPIFRNHVNYSAIIVTVLPFMWAYYRNRVEKVSKILMFGVILLFITGAYFSYTRAAQLCVFIAIGTYFIFKFRMARFAIIGACMIGLLFVTHLITNNKYLDYAPDFEKTVAHTKFDNLLEATMKMEDISTMERVYRWVAGSYMFTERPITGFGPGSFYNHYKGYTVLSFETYVSDNPEKSGIHSYYLMTLVEQGIIGLLIFLALCFTIIIMGERVYHSIPDENGKRYVMAATLSTVVICALCLINDLIEVDKVGPFFFLNASIIVIFDLKYRDQATNE